MRDGLLEFVEIEGMIRQNDEGRTYYVAADSVRVIEEPCPGASYAASCLV